jgi:hypothetical protein
MSWTDLKRPGKFAVVATLLLALAALVVFLYAAVSFPVDKAAAWFTGEALVIAIVALPVAGLAALFAFPAYRDSWIDRRRHPLILVGIYATNIAHPDQLELMKPRRVTKAGSLDRQSVNTIFVDNGEAPDIFVRVFVANKGDAPVGVGKLRISIQASACDRLCVKDDDPGIFHFEVPGTIVGKQAWRSTVARDDFPPGVHMYHVQTVDLKLDKEFVFGAVVEGDRLPNPAGSDVVLEVAPWPVDALSQLRDR